MSTSDDSRPASTLGGVRRTVDALIMATFGVICLTMAGTTDSPVLTVLVGIGALGYGAWIGLAGAGYMMPYILYLIPLAGLFWLFKG